MRRSMTISLLAIVAVAVIALGATLVGGNSPRLGLDLQGGASVVLSPVAGKPVPKGALNQAERIIRRRVDGLGVAEPSITRQGPNIVVELPGVKNAATALAVVGQTAELQFRAVIGGPFPGPGPAAAAAGSTPPGSVPSPAVTTVPSSAPASPTTIVPATVPPASPPTSGALGTGRSPGVSAAAIAAAVPAALPAQASPAPGAPTPGATPAPTPGATSAPTPGATPAPSPGTTPAPGATPAPVTGSSAGPPITPTDQLTERGTVILPEIDPKTGQTSDRYALGPVLLKGDIVSTANPTVDQTTGTWRVQVNFTGKGSGQFDNVIARGYYGKQVAIVLDNKIESAPSINAQQFNGVATISGGAGGFTHKQASDLSLVLRYGALPVQLTQSDVQTISASLGKDSLRAGLIAGIIGLGLVLLYMIAYYRALGVVVLLGLSVSGALLFSIVSYLGVTVHQSLSLSGVVGIIVSVGVTVDSYIVYFERLKDDIRAGRSIRASVDRSFARAWRTIWTADLVSIIAAALLFLLTVGAVRGFAFFLGLSTLLDLLVAYTFTRPMVFILGRNRTFTEAPFLGVARGLAAPAPGGAA
ncbi:MAG: hypothetical protein NVSMB16_11710 [Acidimicrobiales bacterium]